MRILIDNCVSRRFAKKIEGHDVVQARQRGWEDLKNGDLIAAAEKEGFNALVTTDKNLRHQQNLRDRRICVIVLAPRMTFYDHLMTLMPQLSAALADLSEGEFVVIEPLT